MSRGYLDAHLLELRGLQPHLVLVYRLLLLLQLPLGLLQLVHLLQVVFRVLDQLVDLPRLLRHLGLAELQVDVSLLHVGPLEVRVLVILEQEDCGSAENNPVQVEESFAVFDALAVEEQAGLHFGRAGLQVHGAAAVFVCLELEQRVLVEDAQGVEADVRIVVLVLPADRDDLLVLEGVHHLAREHGVFVDVRDVREVHVEFFAPVLLVDLLLRVHCGLLEGLLVLLHDHHLRLQLLVLLHELVHQQLQVFAVRRTPARRLAVARGRLRAALLLVLFVALLLLVSFVAFLLRGRRPAEELAQVEVFGDAALAHALHEDLLEAVVLFFELSDHLVGLALVDDRVALDFLRLVCVSGHGART